MLSEGVYRSESVRSENSDTSQSKRVSFNNDVDVKHIPRGALLDRHGRLLGLTRPEDVKDSYAGYSVFKESPKLSEQEIAREAERIIQQVDQISCLVSPNPSAYDTRSLERKSRKNHQNQEQNNWSRTLPSASTRNKLETKDNKVFERNFLNKNLQGSNSSEVTRKLDPILETSREAITDLSSMDNTKEVFSPKYDSGIEMEAHSSYNSGRHNVNLIVQQLTEETKHREKMRRQYEEEGIDIQPRMPRLSVVEPDPKIGLSHNKNLPFSYTGGSSPTRLSPLRADLHFKSENYSLDSKRVAREDIGSPKAQSPERNLYKSFEESHEKVPLRGKFFHDSGNKRDIVGYRIEEEDEEEEEEDMDAMKAKAHFLFGDRGRQRERYKKSYREEQIEEPSSLSYPETTDESENYKNYKTKIRDYPYTNGKTNRDAEKTTINNYKNEGNRSLNVINTNYGSRSLERSTEFGTKVLPTSDKQFQENRIFRYSDDEDYTNGPESYNYYIRQEDPSPEPIRSRSPVPIRNRSPEPIRNRLPKPIRSRSPEQIRNRSPEHIRNRSPEHVRNRSPEPSRSRSPKPIRNRSPVPIRNRSPEPIRSRSPKPVRNRSQVPIRNRSPKLVRNRSPEPIRNRSPEPIRDRRTQTHKTGGISPERTYCYDRQFSITNNRDAEKPRRTADNRRMNSSRFLEQEQGRFYGEPDQDEPPKPPLRTKRRSKGSVSPPRTTENLKKSHGDRDSRLTSTLNSDYQFHQKWVHSTENDSSLERTDPDPKRTDVPVFSRRKESEFYDERRAPRPQVRHYKQEEVASKKYSKENVYPYGRRDLSRSPSPRRGEPQYHSKLDEVERQSSSSHSGTAEPIKREKIQRQRHKFLAAFLGLGKASKPAANPPQNSRGSPAGRYEQSANPPRNSRDNSGEIYGQKHWEEWEQEDYENSIRRGEVRAHRGHRSTEVKGPELRSRWESKNADHDVVAAEKKTHGGRNADEKLRKPRKFQWAVDAESSAEQWRNGRYKSQSYSNLHHQKVEDVHFLDKEDENHNWNSATLNRLEHRTRKVEDQKSRNNPPRRPYASMDLLDPDRNPKNRNIRYFGDTDRESQQSDNRYQRYESEARHRSSAQVNAAKRGHQNGHAAGSSSSALQSSSGGHALITNSLHVNSSGSEAGSQASNMLSAASADSGASQRSVYLHAATVADIPSVSPRGAAKGPAAGAGRRIQSREDLSTRSVASSAATLRRARHTSRSFSVLAPWKPRHYREKYEITYTNNQMPINNENLATLGKPPRPPRRREDTISDSEQLQRATVARSSTVPKNSGLAGWFRKKKR